MLSFVKVEKTKHVTENRDGCYFKTNCVAFTGGVAEETARLIARELMLKIGDR